jgi:hypothetical protein
MGTFVNEAISVPGRINGRAIIDDLCHRIAERLGRNCDLREQDSYSNYSARVVIDLSLVDVDRVSVVADMVIGTSPAPTPAQPVAKPAKSPLEPSTSKEPVELDVRPVYAEDIIGSAEPQPSLEVNVDGSPIEAPPAPADNVSRTRSYPSLHAKPLSHRHQTE